PRLARRPSRRRPHGMAPAFPEFCYGDVVMNDEWSLEEINRRLNGYVEETRKQMMKEKRLPDLVVHEGNLPATVDALRDLIAHPAVSMIVTARPRWSLTSTARW